MVKRHRISDRHSTFFVKRKNVQMFVADKRTVISFAKAGARQNRLYLIGYNQLIVARCRNQNAFGQNGWDIFKAVNSADFFGQILRNIYINALFRRYGHIPAFRLATRERRERSSRRMTDNRKTEPFQYRKNFFIANIRAKQFIDAVRSKEYPRRRKSRLTRFCRP